jgi:hypothetical protein
VDMNFKNFYKLYFTLACIVCYSMIGSSQSNASDQSEVKISRIDLIEKVASHYGYKLYYKQDEQLEEVLPFDNSVKELQDVLDYALRGTTLGSMLYRDYAVVIMPTNLLGQELSLAYLKAKEAASQTVGTDALKTVGQIEDLGIEGKVVLEGRIYDLITDEPLIGATIYSTTDSIGTQTDIDGSYSFEIYAGTKEISVSYLGYGKHYETVDVRSSGQFDIPMSLSIDLEEVTINARSREHNVANIHIGAESLDMLTLDLKPTILGEVDIMKSFLLEPGVSSVSDGAPGINVRGGNVDQNLIQLDESFIFNTSHALGFFSIFNSDLVSSATLYKGVIPAQFGGRLASVMDIRMKDGNFDKPKIDGSFGLISSKINISTPIIKDKLSFIGSARLSYVNWLLNSINDVKVKNSSTDFYDFNGRFTYRISNEHIISLSGFQSNDQFNFNDEFGFDYSTKYAELMYRATLGKKLFSKLSATTHRYNSSRLEFGGTNSFKLDHIIKYLKIKESLKYVANDNTELNFGGSAIIYDIEPNTVTPLDSLSIVSPLQLSDDKAREFAAFIDGTFKFGDNIEISPGVRLTHYQQVGPKREYEYLNPDAPSAVGLGESILREGVLFSQTVIEPRLFLKYQLDVSSIKLGYSRTSQFINQFFNADSPIPTSQWQVSSRYIAPQRSHNFSLGYFQNLDNNTWEVSSEVYYRNIDEVFDYKDFARLLSNDHVETELLHGIGRSYGLELQLRKRTGKMTGWVSYSYSKTQNKIDGINSDEWYPTFFDLTHNVSSTLNVVFSERKNLSVNAHYNIGRPTTPPIGTVTTSLGNIIPLFGPRNSTRIPDTYRLDVSYSFQSSKRMGRKFKTHWVFTLYNVLGRRNPYSVYYEKASQGLITTNRISVLGSILPSVSLKFTLE